MSRNAFPRLEREYNEREERLDEIRDRLKKDAECAPLGALKRRSVIRINTDQAVEVVLVFVPGGKPYIHFAADHIQGYSMLSGFIDDKDVAKFKRFARSLP